MDRAGAGISLQRFPHYGKPAYHAETAAFIDPLRVVGVSGEDRAELCAFGNEFLHQQVEQHGSNALPFEERVCTYAGKPAPAAVLLIDRTGLGYDRAVGMGHRDQDGPRPRGYFPVGNEADIRIRDALLVAGDLAFQHAAPVLAADPVAHPVVIVIQIGIITADFDAARCQLFSSFIEQITL